MNRRGAASIAELVLVLCLFGAVGTVALSHVTVRARAAATQRDRVRVQELLRTAAVVLGAELRFIAREDVLGAGGDSVRLRAFRGGGPVCAGDGARVWVRYRGVRDPEPEKDSLLLVLHDTTIVSAIRSAVASDRCGPLRLTLDPAPPRLRGYALVFESGSYMVAGNAVRYRRGRGGRQPLTETILAPGSGLVLDSVGAALRLAPVPGPRRDAPATRIRASSLNPLGQAP